MTATFSYGGGTAKLLDFFFCASVGISPGIAQFRVSPLSGLPALGGDLVFGDGTSTLTLRDCYLDRDGVRGVSGRGGRALMVRVLDRRWRWQTGYAVDGHYNQQDSRGKLIPGTVRSPYQLARLLLTKMGEWNYPPRWEVTGTFDELADYEATIEGETFTSSAVSSGATDIGGIIADLIEQIEAFNDPDFHAAIDVAAEGDKLVVTGTKPGVEIAVEAESTAGQWAANKVADEHPFIDLPGGLAGAPQRWQVTGVYDSDATYSVTVNGVPFTCDGADFDDINEVVADFAAQISASSDPAIDGVVEADNGPDTLTLTGVGDADGVEVIASVAGGPTGLQWTAANLTPPAATAGLPRAAHVTGSYNEAATYRVQVNGVAFGADGADHADIGEVVAALASDINASTDPAIVGLVTASAPADTLILEAAAAGIPLSVQIAADAPYPGVPWGVTLYRSGREADTLIDATTEFLSLGQQCATPGTNPVTVWVATPAAVALANLCDLYGRVVVFDPITDRVSIQVMGEGVGLPPGPLTSYSPALDPKQVPRRITVVGSPTRYQIRIRLMAVGRDWDGSWRRLADLSYAPERAEQTMRVEVLNAGSAGLRLNGVAFTGTAAALAADINASADPAIDGKVTATDSGTTLILEGVEPGYEFEVAPTAAPPNQWEAVCKRGPIPVADRPGSFTVRLTGSWNKNSVYGVGINGSTFTAAGSAFASMSAVASELASLIEASADPDILAKVDAIAAGDVLTIAVSDPGIDFTVTTNGTVLAAGSKWVGSVELGPLPGHGGNGFEKVHPPFAAMPDTLPQAITGTVRLTRYQAAELANASVFRCYQVELVDPFDGSPGLPFPGVSGRVESLSRFILLPSRPEQAVPRAPDADRLGPGNRPVMESQYDGYSKDRPLASFGSVNVFVSRTARWTAPRSYIFDNSRKRSRFYVPFGIADPERQVFQFAEPVYRKLADACLPPDLVVEVGAILLEPGTFAPVRYRYSVDVPGGLGPEEVIVRPDVRQEVIGSYHENHELLGHHVQDADAENRARYYATERARQFQIIGAQTNGYGGLRAVSLSGLTRQVSWEMGRDGFFTTASASTEHSQVIIPYQSRRFRENLPAEPWQQAAQQAAGRGAGPAPNADKLNGAELRGNVLFPRS